MTTVPAEWKKLADEARCAQKSAYAPYSKFEVGCAVEDEQGRIYTGCNVENASYSLCICAERSAVAQLVCAGGKQVVRVALITASNEACFPCGSCLQVINEFGAPSVLAMNQNGDVVEQQKLEALLPFRFSKKQLADRPKT